MTLIMNLCLCCLDCEATDPFAGSVKEAINLWEERLPKTSSAPETEKPHEQAKKLSGDVEVT